jgi:ATP-dependent DNA helicase RecG
MTATPIPRSLALTVYGELDISILDEYPKHRAGIDTKIISPNSISQMYEAINTNILSGRQAYIVCPLISESSITATPSAEETFEKLSKSVFKHLKVGLLHGKMNGKEKDLVMTQFKDGQIDILISTTVIEVGVDVPNATEMVILGADRFGLAQLHQLRGRVGRGEHRGNCYLVMSDSTKPSQRMRAIESTTNGFELAEYDLEIRGPGAIYGTMQHGSLDLRHVKFDDHKLIAEVRGAIKQFDTSSQNMLKYPQLAKKVAKTLQVTYLN